MVVEAENKGERHLFTGVDIRKTSREKGAWGMPRLSEAKKDVTSCEKPR